MTNKKKNNKTKRRSKEKMQSLKKKNKELGITLVALAVTIVILLILAGISISLVLGQNGLITKAQEAKTATLVSEEKGAIQLEILAYQMNNVLNTPNEGLIGTKLSDKTASNVEFSIIVNNQTKETYGTGWIYIAKGEEVPNYGQTQYAWVVNYNTGEMIQLEENSYQELSGKLATTDGLIFNMDASNLDEDVSKWGDNVTLYYYDDTTYDTMEKRQEAYNEQAAYTSVTDYGGYDRQVSTDTSNYVDKANAAFKFNGNNYIEVVNDNSFDFSNGLTFEFYGNVSENVPATNAEEMFIGLFGLWSGKYNSQCNTRFGYSILLSNLYYSLSLSGYGSWSNENWPWNQQHDIGNFLNNDTYFTITFDNTQTDEVTQTIYLNGELLDSGYITKEYYNSFLEKSQELKYLELGRCTMTDVPNWCYTKGLCYTTRMYNRALSADEVSNNYSATVAYRNSIKK